MLIIIIIKNSMLKIWILDSWMGGHYALLDIKSHFPQYKYETYLDHKNAPYGNKSGEEIYKLAEAWCLDLWKRDCNLILIACNTICAETLRHLQDTYPDKKILWCIIPSVEIAVMISHKNIGLIGTKFTVNSWKYEREIAKLSDHHTLIALETPELAGFIEAWMQEHKYTLEYLERRIDSLILQWIDSIILACTHYTVFYEHISLKYPKIKIIDSARTQTIKLGEYLIRHPELWK